MGSMTQPISREATDIDVRPAAAPMAAERRRELMTDLAFGQVFTEHMVSMRWTAERGWHDGQLRPRAAIELDPASLVLHYGQAVFEGLKAYRQADGSVAAFRPLQNARRFQRSAERLAMPPLPEDTFVRALELLVRQDRDWVPTEPEQSLYLRPFMFATEPTLGVRPAREYLFLLIASPVGSYFPRGIAPVTAWISTDRTRAVPGGTGDVKFAGNYAQTFVIQQEAAAHGCEQVLWLDSREHRWIEEMGAMNVFFVYEEGGQPRLVTPALTGTLLPGVVRDALVTLARDLGYPVAEGAVSVDDLRPGGGESRRRLSEVFACGTAAVITPVGGFKSDAGAWTIGDGRPGPVALRLRRALLDVQQGQAPDPHRWMHHIC
jgi:branched-chain amino acid aminotransferase